MPHTGAILLSTPHKSRCVLRPSRGPTKVPLSPWTVAVPHMITLCSHPLAAPHKYLTALSDTCCALCGSPLPPNPLVCPKQVPLPPCVPFCATHASHSVASPLLYSAAVPLYPHRLSVPQMGPASPLTPCCTLHVVHSTPVPLLQPILPPTVPQTGPMPPTIPQTDPVAPSAPHSAPRRILPPPSGPYADLPRGAPSVFPSSSHSHTTAPAPWALSPIPPVAIVSPPHPTPRHPTHRARWL